MATLFLALAITSEVVSTTALRYTAGGHAGWWVWLIVGVGYILSFTMLQRCLAAGFPLGIAYAIWCGVGIVAVAVIAFILFREHLALVQVIGLALVIVGIGCLELGQAHPRSDSTGTTTRFESEATP